MSRGAAMGARPALALGLHHGVSLTQAGAVHCSGWNDAGQCDAPAHVRSARDIAAGDRHSMALMEDRTTVVCWGQNRFGQAPEEAVRLPAAVVAMDAGQFHSVALTEDGRVIAWGGDNFGQVQVPADLPPCCAVAAGGDFTAAVTADGRIVAWGDNRQGQAPPEGVAPPQGTRFVAASAGSFHGAGVTADGRVVGWGDNSVGQAPQNFQGVDDAVSVACGAYHTLVLSRSGALHAFGRGAEGQGKTPAGTFQAVRAGGCFSACVDAEGGVKAWGDDKYGQLGIADAPL